MNSKLFPHYNSVASSIKVTESNSVDSICFNSNEDNPNLMDVIIKHKDSSIEKFSITKTWTKSLQDSICHNVECMDKNIKTDRDMLTEASKVYSIIKNKKVIFIMAF